MKLKLRQLVYARACTESYSTSSQKMNPNSERCGSREAPVHKPKPRKLDCIAKIAFHLVNFVWGLRLRYPRYPAHDSKS